MEAPINNPVAGQETKEGEILSHFVADSAQTGRSVNEGIEKAANVPNEETMKALCEYGEVLRGIHNRLLSEGYVYENGRFYKNGDKI